MTKKGAVAAKTAVLKRRTFTREFKLQVIREIEAGNQDSPGTMICHTYKCMSPGPVNFGRWAILSSINL